MQSLQSTYAQNIGTANAAPRERNRCIEAILKDIYAELSESLNSSTNLADKLRGQLPEQASKGESQPTPSDVFSRLEEVLITVRAVNHQLSNAHNAISG